MPSLFNAIYAIENVVPFKHGVVIRFKDRVQFLDLRVDGECKCDIIYTGLASSVEVGPSHILCRQSNSVQVIDENGPLHSDNFPPGDMYMVGDSILYKSVDGLRDYADVSGMSGCSNFSHGPLVTPMIPSKHEQGLVKLNNRWYTMVKGKLTKSGPPSKKLVTTFCFDESTYYRTPQPRSQSVKLSHFRTCIVEGNKVNVVLTGKDKTDRMAAKLPAHVMNQVSVFCGLTRNYADYYRKHDEWLQKSHNRVKRNVAKENLAFYRRKRVTCMEKVEQAQKGIESAMSYHEGRLRDVAEVDESIEATIRLLNTL